MSRHQSSGAYFIHFKLKFSVVVDRGRFVREEKKKENYMFIGEYNIGVDFIKLFTTKVSRPLSLALVHCNVERLLIIITH